MYAKIINEETKACEVGIGTNIDFYKSIGMSEMDVEQGFDGNWYLQGYAPKEPVEHKNEQIRQQRQSRFTTESDPLYLDYVEAQARGDETVDEKKQLWLDKKDEIRNDLPYVVDVKTTTKKRRKSSVKAGESDESI